MMKVMVCHFVSDSHEIMTALIVMLPLIAVVEISLQLHQAFFSFVESELPYCSTDSDYRVIPCSSQKG
jgi:hypothetical protein